MATKHGLHGTPEYRSWLAMRQRCNNPTSDRYKDYGGRGIKVCERWDSFNSFLKDMGNKPNKTYTIDRIDNTKGYSPENCRWADTKQQALNRRSSLFITYAGKKATAYEWAQVYGINYVTLVSRKRRGWSDTEAIEGKRYGLI